MSYSLLKPLAIDTLDQNMVFVQGGTFEMGGESWLGDAKPLHPVTLRSFELCRFPVTESFWLELSDYIQPGFLFGNPNRSKSGVIWKEAIVFCNTLSEICGLEPCYNLEIKGDSRINLMANGYRLPTEAEWEYAARGGEIGGKDFFSFSGSQELSEVGWWPKNNYGESIPPGLKRPNCLGLYDMSGNSWEWVHDWYSPDYYDCCINDGITENPNGPQSGRNRVVRGGSWYLDHNCFRVSDRSDYDPEFPHFGITFRICRNSFIC